MRELSRDASRDCQTGAQWLNRRNGKCTLKGARAFKLRLILINEQRLRIRSRAAAPAETGKKTHARRVAQLQRCTDAQSGASKLGYAPLRALRSIIIDLFAQARPLRRGADTSAGSRRARARASHKTKSRCSLSSRVARDAPRKCARAKTNCNAHVTRRADEPSQ